MKMGSFLIEFLFVEIEYGFPAWFEQYYFETEEISVLFIVCFYFVAIFFFNFLFSQFSNILICFEFLF